MVHSHNFVSNVHRERRETSDGILWGNRTFEKDRKRSIGKMLKTMMTNDIFAVRNHHYIDIDRFIHTHRARGTIQLFGKEIPLDVLLLKCLIVCVFGLHLSCFIHYLISIN